jgi:Arc/MetJ family transcription regulator
MTTIAINSRLLDHALKVNGASTRKATVTKALREFSARREQRRNAELFGNTQ